jgi:HPt (histidine-containing phosphotransfer) domain-containing protein
LREVSDLIGQQSRVNPPPWMALDELCEEAAIFRRIARTSPDALPPLFCEDLDRLAYRVLNKPGEVALAARILLDAHRALAEASPAAFKPGLAKAMVSLASIFPRHEALQLQEDAVGVYRELAAGDPATFLPALAMAIRGLADQMTRLGQAEEAFRTISDLADTCHSLAEASPAIYLPVLAEALSDLADRVRQSGPEKSLVLEREAAAIYCTLADEDPVRFGSRRTSSLDTLAYRLQKLDKREEELSVIRAAIDAHRARAEYIGAIRRQIETRTTASTAFRALDLAESQPAEFLPTLADAVRDLAVEMNIAGRRREALTLAREATSIHALRRYLQIHGPTVVMAGETWEASAVDRMAALALRLWKLGEQQEALATARTCCELAPAGRLGANAPDPARAWHARLLIRLWEASDKRRQREQVRFWRGITRLNHRYRPPITDNVSDWRVLGAPQRLGAQQLERLSDGFDTLAFRRQVVGRNADALTATRHAAKVQGWAVSIYRRQYASADLARSLDTLALRLRMAGQPGEAANAAHEASRIRDLLRRFSGRLS